MRFPPCHYLQCLAASNPAMSYSRVHFQWRRSFSDGVKDSFVTGDSHLTSVIDSNSRFRPGGQHGHFTSSGQSQFYRQSYRQQQPPPHYGHPPSPPPHYGHPQPPSYEQPQRSYRQAPPYYGQPRHFNQLRPRVKLPDYRHWQYAASQPPSHCERFVVLSYNILADYLAINHRSELYFHIPRHILDWEWRKRKIVFELGLWSADIMCLQEVDKFQDLEEELKLHGYSGIWKMRTGNPVDGCAIFWRTARFKLLHEEYIEFNKLGLRDNVAQICVLELTQNPDHNDSPALPPSSNGLNRIVVCNIHVLYNPRRGEIKLGQVRVLLDRAHAVSKLWSDAPVTICGDFNCTPKSPLYNFISEQKLSLNGLGRDQISGQSTAELHKPKQYTPTPWRGSLSVQTPDNSGRDSMLVDDTEVSKKHINHVSSMHTNEQSLNQMERMPSTNRLIQIQSDSSTLNTLNELCSLVDDGNCNTIPHKEVEETQQEVIDSCKNESTSNFYIPFESLKECPVSRPEEATHDAALGKTEAQDMTPPLTSCEYISCVVLEHGHEEQPSGLVHDDKEKKGLDLGGNVNSFEGKVLGTKSGLDKKPETALASDNSSSLESGASISDEDKAPLAQRLEDFPLEPLAGEEMINQSTSDQHAYQVNMSTPTAVDLAVDCMVADFNKPSEAQVEDGSFDQDRRRASPNTVNRTDDDFQFNLDHGRESVRLEVGEGNYNSDECGTARNAQLSPSFDETQSNPSPSFISEPTEAKKYTSDLYSWTPMEIQTASGNAECYLLEHPLKLRSTYVEVEDYSGTRDSSREPEVTSYNRRFMGTVDYIWCSEGLQTVKVLDTIPKRALQWTPGFPTPKWGSDHIALVSQLAFTKRLSDPV